MSLLALVMRSKYVSPAWAIFKALRPAVRCFSGTVSTAAAPLEARCVAVTARGATTRVSPELRPAPSDSVPRDGALLTTAIRDAALESG